MAPKQSPNFVNEITDIHGNKVVVGDYVVASASGSGNMFTGTVSKIYKNSSGETRCTVASHSQITPYRILKLQTKEGTKKHAAIYLAMPNCN